MPQAAKYHCRFGFPKLIQKLTRLPVLPHAFVFTKTYISKQAADDCRRKFWDFVMMVGASDQKAGTVVAEAGFFEMETE